MLDLAERIAEAADALGIQTALIGAMALAAHNYVRGTQDVDLATNVDPERDLQRLQRALESVGLHTKLSLPDADDPLGGVLRVWETEDAEGDPILPVDLINFSNPHRPVDNPGAEAIRTAIRLDETSSLRYARLPELIALKLYAGSRRDHADVVEVLARNPDVDIVEVRSVCQRFECGDVLDALVAEAQG